MPKISVVISTYNNPVALEKVLWSYSVQDCKDFEIVIADDGSAEATARLIEEFKKRLPVLVLHVWHPDVGFQKTKILNKAIAHCTSDYILMTDGDCIARADMLSVHLQYRKEGHFLSGGNLKLSKTVSEKIGKEAILDQSCFFAEKLIAYGFSKPKKLFKITCSGWKEKLLNRFSPTKATWDGNNASAWKKDILAVNGFDERMQYGGEDREFGERLMHYGIQPIQIRYSTKGLHLHHERSYVQPEMLVKNKAIRKETKRNKTYFTAFGIKKTA